MFLSEGDRYEGSRVVFKKHDRSVARYLITCDSLLFSFVCRLNEISSN